jgi:hypothetical protein
MALSVYILKRDPQSTNIIHTTQVLTVPASQV